MSNDSQEAANRREAIRGRAQEVMKDKIMKPGAYGFIVDDYRLLKRKDDKPPTIIVDAYPLRNVKDVGSSDQRFKRAIWVNLLGADDWYPDDPQVRDQSLRNLAALFPDHVPPIVRTDEGYFFNEQKMAYKDAQTEQAVYAIDVAQQIWDGKVTPAENQFFYGIVTLNDDKSRNWTNPITYEPEDGVGIPEEFQP